MGRRKALNFLQKLQIDFCLFCLFCLFFLINFLHVASLYFIFLFWFFKKNWILGNNQNWVITFSSKNQAWWERKTTEKKGKKSDGGCSCKVLFSLFGVVKILSFMMIQPPSPALNILLQFNPSFSTFQFSPWSKKNPLNQSRELGLNPSRGRILCLHVRYSNRNLWSRSRSEIKSFVRTESSSNLVGQKGSPILIQKLTMPSVPIWLRAWNKNKSHKICDENRVFFSADSGQYPSRDRILYLYVRYSNGNILSFWYWNQAIQKPKIIYTSRNTTFMK